jgi:uncharacterized protein
MTGLPEDCPTPGFRPSPQETAGARRCDVRSLARTASVLQGEARVADLPRLAAGLEPPAAEQAPPVYGWRARGELRAVLGGPAQVWLHLQAQGPARLVCQRCLQPMEVDLVAERSFLFVNDEATAARLDEEMDDDVLVLPRALDLLELVEDELILALPLVPRHDRCPHPLPLPPAGPGLVEEEEPHPFAALAALKQPPQV